MDRVAFVLVRVLALYVGAQAIINSMPPFQRFDAVPDWTAWMPFALGILFAVLLWTRADGLARKLQRDADLWLPIAEEEDDEAEETGEVRGQELVLSKATVAQLVQIALLVVGVVLIARALHGFGIIAGIWAQQGSIDNFGGSSWLRLYAPEIIGQAIQFGIGLVLALWDRGLANALARFRDPYVARAYPDDEDENGDNVTFKFD